MGSNIIPNTNSNISSTSISFSDELKHLFVKNVLEVAKSYVGELEIEGNQGFKDGSFDKKMEAVGFEKGMAWCALFTELVYKEAIKLTIPNDDKMLKAFDKLFSASSVKTRENFSSLKNFGLETKPAIGSLICFQMYSKSGDMAETGHIGIVVDILPENRVLTIEGNTSFNGSREGLAVEYKKRLIDLSIKKGGLTLTGFINIKYGA